MRFVVGLLACVGAMNLALADDPPAVPAAASAAPAASAPAAAAAAPAQATAATAAAQVTVDRDIQHFTQEGFKPEMRHGQELYCRRELALGSRLAPQKTCGTIEELRAMERRNKADLEQAQKRQTSSPNGTMPGR
jgi:hypothetical protein